MVIISGGTSCPSSSRQSGHGTPQEWHTGIGFAKRGTLSWNTIAEIGDEARSGAFLLHWPWHHSTSLSVAFSSTFHPPVASDDFTSSICLLTFENGPASTSLHIRLATTSCIFNVKETLAGGPSFFLAYPAISRNCHRAMSYSGRRNASGLLEGVLNWSTRTKLFG